MLLKPRFINKTSKVSRKTPQIGRISIDFRSLLFIIALGLSACASFGTSSTPTPQVPTPAGTPVPATATPPPSVAIVNGEYITLAEFQAELARYKSTQVALGVTVSDEEANKVVLEDMLAQFLLAQAAGEANFNFTEADLQSRIEALASEIGGAQALSAWQSAYGYDDASFRVALKRSVESAWMRDKIIAHVPATVEQIHVRQILTYNEEDARAALEELKTGADFDELAALYDPITLGELGWLPRGYLLDASADEAVFALQAGKYTEIIATNAGYHIFKALERGDHLLSPDALLTMQELALRNWLVEKRANSDIVLAP
ncbi:MAG: SurA N-terminal domain-containing protein [Anaerolineales bacterium]|nr:SurA N-terminal domain-containing protein [Anaerolineales bacterium]